MYLINVYSEHFIDRDMVYALIPSSTRQAKKIISEAKSNNRFIDYCCGNAAKSIILLTNNTVVSCCYSTKTIASNLQKENPL